MMTRQPHLTTKHRAELSSRQSALLLGAATALCVIAMYGTGVLPHRTVRVSDSAANGAARATSPGSIDASDSAPSVRVGMDLPYQYGPAALMWEENRDNFRAVHYIAKWQPNQHKWLAVSPDLTEANAKGADGQGIDGITSVAHEGDAWYVGTLVGNVQVKLPGQSWTEVAKNLPARSVTALAICPDVRNGQMAAVGYGGYSAATPLTPGHLYVTLTGGSNWLDLTGDLPDAPVDSIHFGTLNGRTELLVSVRHRWYSMGAPGHWNES